MNQTRSIVITLILIAAVGGLFLLASNNILSTRQSQKMALHENKLVEQSPPNQPHALPQAKDVVKETESAILATAALDHLVPFHAQAPTGNWSDPAQANACEETSLLMASWYFYNQTLTAEEAIDEIHRLSDIALDLFGEFRDESTRDTLLLGQTVFPDLTFTLVERPTIENIQQELDGGNLVLVPVDGTVLVNPYYTPPGPRWHKLVIRGYDDAREVFITNDPGTKRGKGIEYSYDNLMKAIGDYKTGFHEPLPPVREKIMIVVGM